MIFKPVEIDRGIAVRLQDILALNGYWPDMNLFLPEPIDEDAFNAALDAIRTAKKVNPIEVFYPNSPRDGLQVDDGHITIRRNFYSTGDIGFGSSVAIEPKILNPATPADQRFRKVKHQETSFHIDYEIRFVAKTGNMHRIIDEMMAMAFGARKYIYGVNDDRSFMDEGFEMFLNGLPTEIKGPDWIERMYRFQVKDVFITQPEVIVDNIMPVSRIDVGIASVPPDTEFDQLEDGDFITIVVEPEE